MIISILIKSLRKSKLSIVMMFLLLVSATTSKAQIPVNDEPCAAITLTASTNCNYQTFTNDNATGSAVTAPLCAQYAGEDVWFKVVVPSGGLLYFDTQDGILTDGGMAIYSGTCNNLTVIDCDDDASPNANGLMPYIVANGLTPGDTIWVRVWDYGGGSTGTFGICVSIPPPPPSNDEPCNAITLSANAVCAYQTFSNVDATGSNVPDPGCASYSDGDVWFQVVVPQGGAFNISTQAVGMYDGGMAIYSGTCNNLTLIDCDNDGNGNTFMPYISATGLTPGDTIWIRVWHNSFWDVPGSFGICVSLPPLPPVNEDPCTAILVTPSYNCNYSFYSNAAATASTGVPAPGCANYQGGDVWFKVVVPCNGALNFDTQDGEMTDGGMAIYKGSCGNLTLIECNDDGSSNGFMPFITRSNFTPYDTIWIRIWERGNNNNGSFGLCVTIPQPPGPGGTCQTANSFCTGTTYVFPNSTNVQSLGANGIYGCLSTTPNPVWYYMQIQNPGNIDITIDQTSNTGNPIDVDFALWGPFSSLSATCSGISANNIVDCSYSLAATETASITNAQTGEFYLLLITNFANLPGVITFQQTAGTASTSCAVICNTAAANTGPVCVGSALNLSSTTITGGSYSWTGPDCFTSTSQNPTSVTPPSQPGNYNYNVTAVSASGSTCSATTVVTVKAKPNLGSDSALSVCNTTTVNLYNVFDTTGLSSSWTINNNPVVNPASISSSGIYQLIAQSAQSCSDTALFTLAQGQVNGSAIPTDANCTGNGQILANATFGQAPFTYAISSNPGNYQPSASFSVSQGSYTITIKDAGGCNFTTPAVVVGFTNNLTLTANGGANICLGNSATLSTVSNASFYSWSPASGLNNASSPNPIASPTVNTSYEVTATLGSCTKKDTVDVTIALPVSVDAGPPQTIAGGGNVTLQATASGATDYSWTPSVGLNAINVLNPIASPAVTTLYFITASNAIGCSSTDSVLVTVDLQCIRVKNAFSPNGDGTNELWTVYDDFSCLQNVAVHIYNRYGSKVYESRDYRNNWDGRYNGKPLPDGTYYAVIEFTMITGRKYSVKSDVTIIR